MDGVLIAGTIVMLAGAIVWYGHRTTQASLRQASRSPQSDPVGLVILFNSMRDILQQQKDLVRQVNESLNQKVAAVREAAALATENLDRLRETKRRLVLELEELRAEVAGLHREAECLRERGSRSAALQAVDDIGDAPAVGADMEIPAQPVALADPEPEDPLEAWTALNPETESEESEAPDEEDPQPLTDVPEYAESSREALRSLLGLDGPTDEPSPREEAEARPSPARPASSMNAGNGRTVPATVHARVHEYHRAGMSVTQIAQELGLGKGEVRLILGLRKGKRR